MSSPLRLRSAQGLLLLSLRTSLIAWEGGTSSTGCSEVLRGGSVPGAAPPCGRVRRCPALQGVSCPPIRSGHPWNRALLGLAQEGAGLSHVILYLFPPGLALPVWLCHHGVNFILAPSASVSLPSQPLLQRVHTGYGLVPTQCLLQAPTCSFSFSACPGACHLQKSRVEAGDALQVPGARTPPWHRLASARTPSTAHLALRSTPVGPAQSLSRAQGARSPFSLILHEQFPWYFNLSDLG